MQKLHILIAGGMANADGLAPKLLSQPGWTTQWVEGGEEAIEAWISRRPDVVMVSAALGAETESKLSKVFHACDPESRVFTWSRGEEASVVAQIREFFHQRQLARLGNIQVSDTLNPGNLANGIRVIS